MSFKKDMNVVVTGKIKAGPIEWNKSTGPEGIQVRVEGDITTAYGMEKPTLCDRLSHKSSGD